MSPAMAAAAAIAGHFVDVARLALKETRSLYDQGVRYQPQSVASAPHVTASPTSLASSASSVAISVASPNRVATSGA